MRVEAPGKLVLVGEYAVLDGAPALSLAVPYGVACDVTPGPTRQVLTPDGDDRFARAALDAVGAPAATYRFTAHLPVALPEKPGFGGSASATVAALLAGGFRGRPEALAELATRVHRAVQGSGSGVDTATCAFGGGVRVDGARVRSVALPPPIVVYSGSAARTGPRVTAYLAHADRDAFAQRSAAWVDAFPDDPVPTVRDAWRGLCALAAAAGIAYRTPAIDRIVALAERYGGAGKPSGAGGGDCVVAWVPDPAGFVAEVTAAGFPTIPLHPAGAPVVTRS